MTMESDGAGLTDSKDLVDVTIPRHLLNFAYDMELMNSASREVKVFLEELGKSASIDVFSVESRAKGIKSYEEKARKKNDQNGPKYENPGWQIQDCVAARVIVFTNRAREDFLQLLKDSCLHGEVTNPGEKKHNGYDSDHIIITGIKDEHHTASRHDLKKYFEARPGLEVQIRTVAGHAWAEYEHDVRYKSDAYKRLSEGQRAMVDQRFVEAGGQRKFMDQLFVEIHDLLYPAGGEPAGASEVVQMAQTGERGPILTVDSLGKLLGSRHPGAPLGDVTDVNEVLRNLNGMGVDNEKAVESILSGVEFSDIESSMEYSSSTPAIRRFDDEVLSVAGQDYVDAADSESRRSVLDLRRKRLSGKFNIYTLRVDGKVQGPPMSAAKMVRRLVEYVADFPNADPLHVDGAVSVDSGDIQSSMAAKEVDVDGVVYFVATNLTRNYAENLMRELVEKIPVSDVSVEIEKAGDPLVYK